MAKATPGTPTGDELHERLDRIEERLYELLLRFRGVAVELEEGHGRMIEQ